MPFPSPVSAGDKTKMRASGYWNRPLAVLCQNTVVFACRAAQSITDAPFAQFTYDTVTVGAFGNALPGMVFYISSTNDIRAAKYRGRVRKTLTSSIFYCDENATILNDGDYIFVVRDVDLFAKVRKADLMDFDIAYHNLEPQISGLPSVAVLYDANDDGVVSFAPTQSGIPVASTATSSFTWLWTISGDGATSYTSGSSTSQNPVIQLAAGFEYLIQCRATDSNSIPHIQYIRVYAVDFDFAALVVGAIVSGNVSHDVDNGFIGNVTAYADVNSILDRTHVTIFRVEHFGTGNEDSVFTNVLMCGRLRSETDNTAGDSDAGRIKETTFPVEGITSYLQRLRVPPDIIRASAAPDEWGEITEPTLYRALCYMMSNYTTLTNICSFDADSAYFAAWEMGGEPVSADGGYALELMKTLLDRIKATANFAPTGEIFMQIMASYQVDRSGIQTIMDFDESEGDYRDFQIERDTSDITSQVTAYGGMFNSANNAFVLFTALAPTIIYGDAPETAELNRELLEADSTVAEARSELGTRAANHVAFINPKPLLRVTFKSGFSGILIATLYQRWTHTIAASANTRGIAYTSADYWQLQSVNITINTDGSLETSGDFIAETEFADAQAVASLLPINLSGMNPEFPVLSNDPAFPDEPLWMFPTDTPTTAEQPAIDPYSLYMTGSPFTPDQAAQAAAQQGTVFCRPLQVNFKNSGTVQTDWSTVNGAGYTITVRGDAQIAEDTWVHTFDFTEDDGGWTPILTFHGGTYTPGVGWVASDGGLAGGFYRRGIDIEYTGLASTEFTGLSVTYNYTVGSFDSPLNSAFTGFVGATQVWDILNPAMVNGTGLNRGWSGSDTDTSLRVQINTSTQATPVYSGSAVITRITVTGKGTNPFPGGTTAGIVRGDAFYYGYNEEAGGLAQLYGAEQGLRINSTPITPVPPFNPNHEYSFPYTGDGNPVVSNFADTDYTDNQNALLDELICRNPS